MSDKPMLYVIIELEQSYIGRECSYNTGTLDAFTENKYLAELYVKQFKRCLFSIYEIEKCEPKDIIKNVIKKYGNNECELCTDFTSDYKLMVITSVNNPDVSIITTAYNYESMTELYDTAISESVRIMISSIHNIFILSKFINNNSDLLKMMEILKFYVIRYTLLISVNGSEIIKDKQGDFHITDDTNVYDAADLDYIYMLIFMDDID